MSNRSFGLVATVLVLGVAAPAAAESGEGADDAVQVTGFVDASYSGNLDLGTDTFGLDQAEVDLIRSFGPRGGVRADLEWVKNGDGWELDVEQGFLDYVPTFAPRLTFTLGKFNAPIGFELLDAPDMYQFSHALVFDYGLPTNLTGAMVTVAASEAVEVRAYVVNGWDENDLGAPGPKTVGGRFGYSFGERGGCGVSAIYGRTMLDYWDEGPFGPFDRTVLDADVTLTPMPGLVVGGEVNHGRIDFGGGSPTGAYPSDVRSWTGALVMAHYDFNEWLGLTGRFDVFDDFYLVLQGMGETRTAVTLAPTFALGDGMGALIEVRIDSANEDVFDDGDGGLKGSTTSAAFEMTYSF